MRVVSFDLSACGHAQAGLPPANGKTLHQVIDGLVCIIRRMGSKMRVFAGRQDAAVTEYLLNLKQINASFNQVSSVTVAQAMRGNLFFIPQALTTLRMATCTPPRSKGEVAV